MKSEDTSFVKGITEFARMYGRGWAFIISVTVALFTYVAAGFAIMRFFNIEFGSDLEMYLMLAYFFVPLALWAAWTYRRDGGF